MARLPWYLGLACLHGRTEQGLWYDAADLADAALELDPGNGNAAHTSRSSTNRCARRGLKWLTDWITGDGGNDTRASSGSWHCTNWPWATRRRRPGGMQRSWRRRDRRMCDVSSTRVRWPGGHGCTGLGDPPDPMPVLAEMGPLAYAPPPRALDHRSRHAGAGRRQRPGGHPRHRRTARHRNAVRHFAF